MTNFFLVLIMYGGTTGAPSMTTIPVPYSSYELCVKRGEEFEKTDSYRYSFKCIGGEDTIEATR